MNDNITANPPSKNELLELLDVWVVEVDFNENTILQSDPCGELKKWVTKLIEGKEWLEGQANNWQKEAEERGEYIVELKNWISELEAGKSWLEGQVSNWQKEAETRGKYIEELKKQITQLEKYN
jgi:hypothetical protein